MKLLKKTHLPKQINHDIHDHELTTIPIYADDSSIVYLVIYITLTLLEVVAVHTKGKTIYWSEMEVPQQRSSSYHSLPSKRINKLTSLPANLRILDHSLCM